MKAIKSSLVGCIVATSVILVGCGTVDIKTRDGIIGMYTLNVEDSFKIGLENNKTEIAYEGIEDGKVQLALEKGKTEVIQLPISEGASLDVSLNNNPYEVTVMQVDEGSGKLKLRVSDK